LFSCFSIGKLIRQIDVLKEQSNMFRFFSVTIAGILLTELVGYSRTAAGVLLSLPGNALTEAWLAVSQPLSRRKANSEWGETYLEEENSYLPASSGGIPEIAERDHIRQALASMPQDYAIALILNAAQGVPYQEIAEIVGISPNAAATRISRAKRMFAEHYERLSKQDAAADKERGPVR
jgi:hypothetical protein